MKKISFTGMIILGIVFNAGAQSNAALWSTKFNAYQSVWQKTKLHIIFNQDKYSPGDTAFFKAYFLKEDLTPVSGKQLIDFNLVDSRGESRLHFMFNVNDGVGSNQLAIPDTLSAGIYLITAYSSWMRNFDQALIFKKQISIVRKNTLQPTETFMSRVVAEGGHLVRDISNRISIQTYRPSTTVQILDAAGTEIQSSTTDVHGIGSATFTPTRNGSYFLLTAGESTRISLPRIEDDGCGLLLTPSKNGGPARLVVACPPASPRRNQELTVLLNARGKVVHTDTFTQGNKDFVEIQLPTENLPDGVVHISVLSPTGEILASRDFYSPGDVSVHAEVLAIHKYYQTRERIRLDVVLKDGKGLPVAGEFAISVVNAGLFDVGKKNSLSDELTIVSGAKENFPVDRSDPNWLTSLDNYLIASTQEVPWKEIISNMGQRPRFSFSSVIQKSGTAYYPETHQPVPPSTQIMLYLQRDKKRYLTLASEKGKIGLAIFDVFGRDEFFYFAETRGTEIQNLKIEWDEDPFILPGSPKSRETETPDAYASFIGKTKLINRSYGFYSNPEAIESSHTSNKGNNLEDEIAGGVDVSINIQDYILFPTMEELIKEVIPSLRTRKSGQKSTVRVTLPEPYVPLGDPLYIIDGIATRNTAFFLSFKPVDVLTVKVIRDHQKLGPLSLMGKSGIVIVQTKKGDAREPLNDLSKIIEGLGSPIKFPALDYSTVRDDHRPDFRSTIYWNPSIKTDSDGKATLEFFSSDDIGTLNIHIDGMATGGRAFSAGQELKVGLGPEKK